MLPILHEWRAEPAQRNTTLVGAVQQLWLFLGIGKPEIVAGEGKGRGDADAGWIWMLGPESKSNRAIQIYAVPWKLPSSGCSPVASPCAPPNELRPVSSLPGCGPSVMSYPIASERGPRLPDLGLAFFP